jgi:hypothetical protein
MAAASESYRPRVLSAQFVPAREGQVGHTNIAVVGENFVARAVPVVARLGSQPVSRLVLRSDGRGFAGILEQAPNAGDRLFVGYADAELQRTHVVYRSDDPGPRVA